MIDDIKSIPIGATRAATPEEIEFFERCEAQFRVALDGVLNSFSRENGSDTPDFILGEYLRDCLAAWDKGVTRREEWYGRKDRPPASAK